MKKLPNLSEEIAAMAKTDSATVSSPAHANPSSADQECDKFNSTAKLDDAPKTKKKKRRDELVQEFRISVSFSHFVFIIFELIQKNVNNNSHCPRK